MDVALVGAAGAAAAGLGWGAHAFWQRQFGYPPSGLPPVLAYHKVGSAELGGTWCTRRQFVSHLDSIHVAGWRAIDLVTFAERLEAHASPSRELLLTFDDAWTNFATHAFPELQKRGFPVVLFVVSGCVGQRARWDLPLPGRRALHLDWPALRDLVTAGVEIGSHTETHRDLRRLPQPELERELVVSRRRLEDSLGVRVQAISYPFGRFDARVLAAAAADYRLGFSMCPAWPNARVEPLALRRWGVYVPDTPRTLLDKLDPARRGFWIQDLLTRGINAAAALSAWRDLRGEPGSIDA